VSERQRAGKGVFRVLVVSRDSNFRNRRTQRAQHGIDLFGILYLRAARKTLQTIAFRAWNDVHVEVRNALADAIVGSDKTYPQRAYQARLLPQASAHLQTRSSGENPANR